MPTLDRTRKLKVREDRDGHVLLADGEEVGRVAGATVQVGGRTLEVRDSGMRRVLVEQRAPVLRLDPHGRKATTLTLTDRRYRLARQRMLPLLTRWVLRHDVAGEDVLVLTSGPTGTVVDIAEGLSLSDHDLDLLVAGTLVVALG